MARRHIDSEVKEAALARVKGGEKVTEVASDLKIEKATLYRWLKEIGMQIRPRKNDEAKPARKAAVRSRVTPAPAAAQPTPNGKSETAVLRKVIASLSEAVSVLLPAHAA